jgi:hypothetical protein
LGQMRGHVSITLAPGNQEDANANVHYIPRLREACPLAGAVTFA